MLNLRWCLCLLFELLRWVVRLVGFYHDARDSGSILPLCQLSLIECDVLALEFAHFLYLIEIDHKALLISVIDLNALATEYSAMIRAIEVHDPHIMWNAQFVLCYSTFGGSFVKVNRAKQWISFHHFVQDVNVQG